MCETKRKRGSEAEEQNEQARFVFLVWLQDRKQRQEEVTMKNTMGMYEITTITHTNTNTHTCTHTNYSHSLSFVEFQLLLIFFRHKALGALK